MTTPLRNTLPSGHERRKHTPPPPGEGALLSAAVAMGILLMGIQLWILTVALEQFKRHHYGDVYALTGISAIIFAGGVVMLWLLRKTPRVRHTSLLGSDIVLQQDTGRSALQQ